MVIVSARITALPKTFSDPMPEVYVTMEDGDEHLLFEYYPDEISFEADEFVGLTIEQARSLKTNKDTAYLKS
ncbi:MAG: hypothetical protein IM631_12235 [Cytophagales bacterium]|nr:hypothetical protein [Cytophagales bacterium]MCA6372139.1 hypothetical protein [Cytophagales bacterium]MCA6382283.1 hypothetical protein [Cytophagales bacterium]